MVKMSSSGEAVLENCLRGKIAARIEACACLMDLFAEKPSPACIMVWHYGVDGNANTSLRILTLNRQKQSKSKSILPLKRIV